MRRAEQWGAMANRTVVEGEERALLDRAVDAIREVEPNARVILYGSRARGDAQPDSDWDLLVLVGDGADAQRREAVRDRLFAIELETGAVLSAIVHDTEGWRSAR